MPRRRELTEMIGCNISKPDYEVLKAELKKRRLTVSDYLRDTAVKPLLAQTVDQDGPDAAA